ncbi:hypothetical protein [Rhodococcus jostii]|uniref:Core-binding (CB) domain-containing protein n=1 Tax=Rhodococcus jostii TaxID=132919 RepID=A0ABU4CTR7_RHOJO|nr:hypothetical protein [Rhodococcus jostii]MDV6286978.1 hypothetical protein [Rhodococcus jostii]
MLDRQVQAAGWLRVWTDLGRAPRTIDAYARGLAEYLEMCEWDIDPLTASRAHIGIYVRKLTETALPPERKHGVAVSGSGLVNATIAQRLPPVRLFCDHPHRTLRIRADTTTNRLERVVPYSAPTDVLLSDYLAWKLNCIAAAGINVDAVPENWPARREMNCSISPPMM